MMGEAGKGGRIVVGVEDSPGGRAALAYALREARIRDARVEALGAFSRPESWAGQAIPGWSMGPSVEEIRDRVQAHLDRIVSEIVDEMGPDATGVTVSPHAVAGNAAAALLDSARNADLVVVGNRGRGGFASMMLGSVSLQCALHAPCAVTVVPASLDITPTAPPSDAQPSNVPPSDFIVVGVDGSPDSRAALEYAVTEARLRGARVKVVAAYSFPEYSALGQPYPVLVTPEQIEADVVGAVREVVDEVLAGEEHPPAVTVSVHSGDAADVLTRSASDAVALVVGHRGRGAVASTVLGSVGLRCVLHARCPVTIVGTERRRQRVHEPVAATIPAIRAAIATS